MREERSLLEYGRIRVPLLRWSAIFGGTFFAFGIILILGLFGLAVGAAMAGPEGVSAGAKTFAGIWSLVTVFLGFFAGGWLAARASGSVSSGSGRLHGIVTWGLGSAAILYFLTNSTTRLASMLSGMSGYGNLGQVATPGTVATMTVTAGTWALITVILGLIGGIVGGSVGARGIVEEVSAPDIRRAA